MTFQGLVEDAVIEMAVYWYLVHADSSFLVDSCLERFSDHLTWAGLIDRPLTTKMKVMKVVTSRIKTTMVSWLSGA